ncbi:hypothetical protein BH10BDE1_BH10BDE1_27860 [soil metagenome]
MTRETQHVPSQESLFSTKQAAEYLATSERFLEIRRMKGGGPQYIRVSAKTIRYRQSDLDSWIAERVRSNTSQNAVAI